jgi:hypothetical protein
MKITWEGRSQASKVLKWMVERGSITVATAGDNLRCFCLHKRIGDLKKDGWNIDSTGRLTYTNVDGARVTVAVHKLVEPWHPELARKHPTEETVAEARQLEAVMDGERERLLDEDDANTRQDLEAAEHNADTKEDR